MSEQRTFIKLDQRAKVLTLALTVSLTLTVIPPFKMPAIGAAYNLTDGEVVYALEKAKILGPSIRLNARVGPDEVMVATYKNPKAEDKDCKIEAVLIAKTIMDLAPDQVPRVTVYFYSSSTLTKYKEVAVTAGDVKAFASGSLSKDELIASIKVSEGMINDPKQRIEEHMQESESHRRRKIVTSLKGEDLLVSTALDNNLSERAVKFEAVKLAEQAFEAAPSEVKKVIVTFEDQAEFKENQVLSFNREELKTLGDAIDTTLKEVKVDLVKYAGKFASFTPGTKLDLETVKINDGPFKDERQKLVDRLKELTTAGVGFGTKVTDDLMEIEAKVTSDSEAVLQEKITKLSELIAKFEENLKGAKEHKASPGAKPAASTAPTGGAALAPSVPIPNGDIEALKRMVLADPDGYINAMARGYVHISPITHQPVGKYKTADEHPNFRKNLQFVIDTLTAANRAGEAVKYQKRLDAIKAKYGD